MPENEIKIPDFTQNETLTRFQKYLEYLYNFDMAEEAFTLVNSLPTFLAEIPDFEANHPYLFEEYQKILKSAKILAANFLLPEEIIEIFRANLLVALRQKFPDFWEKIDFKMVTFLMHEDRDKFKEKLRKAMEENQEKIGNFDLEINEKKMPPTVANWLIDYKVNLGEEGADRLKLVDYFNKNRNINRLDLGDRDLLMEVFNIYVRLGISSQSAEGMEEKITLIDEDGTKRVFNKGVLEKLEITDEMRRDMEMAKHAREKVLGVKFPYTYLKKEEEIAPSVSSLPVVKEEGMEKKLPEAADIREKLSKTMAENEPFLKQIIAEEKNIITASQGEMEKLKNYFFEAYQNKELNVALACLLVLARTAGLKNIISDAITQAIFEKDIFPILIKQTAGVDLAGLIDNFRQDKENEIYLKIFLKFIVSRILPEGKQSAYFAWQLENIFRALGQVSYLGLVYYNIGTSQFEWAMVKVNKDGSLVME